MTLTGCVARRVNTVAPGPILTDGTKRHAASTGQALDALCEEMTSKQIIQRCGPYPDPGPSVIRPALGSAGHLVQGGHLTTYQSDKADAS